MMKMIRRTATGAALLVLAAAAVSSAGCSSAGTTQPLTRTAQAPVVTVTKDGAALESDTGPRNTGTYPSFSEPLTAANIQMSDEDAAKQQARLTPLAKARNSGAISEAEYKRRVEEMRKLAAEHGRDTEAAITN